jgi:hypothetical protein
MAKLSAHGPEFARYIGKGGRLLSAREDGVVLCKSVYDRTWKLFGHKKAELTLAEWRARKVAFVESLPAWRRDVKCLPSMACLEEWVSDGVCETPTGDRVEPDGTGPDGAPSWLLIFGMI